MTTRARTTEIWSDFGINLSVNPVTNDLIRITNAEAVKRSVKNLVLGQFYERPFNPLLGSSVITHLFNNLSSETADGIRYHIQEVLENYEPRINIITIIVQPNYDANGFECKIVFSIVSETKPVEIDFFLERVR